jgi:hypothetical protein
LIGFGWFGWLSRQVFALDIITITLEAIPSVIGTLQIFLMLL